MNDEQQAALEALEGALAKCKVANVHELLIGDTYRQSRDMKMSITLITNEGHLNELWVNEAVAQSDKTLEQVVDAGIALMAQHATRVNLFLSGITRDKEGVVDFYRKKQARYIPQPDRYANPAEKLFIRTPLYGRSRPTSSHGFLWGNAEPMARVFDSDFGDVGVGITRGDGRMGWTPPGPRAFTQKELDDLVRIPDLDPSIRKE